MLVNMDVRVIVKQMRESGMTDEDIAANLTDLGVVNPQNYLQDTTATPQMPKPQETAPNTLQEAPSFETIGGGRKPTAKTQSKTQTTPAQSKNNNEEQAPNFQFTRIEGDEEKTVDLEKMLGKDAQNEAPQLMRTVAKSNFNSDEIESRLDETIALLKSLQDINKKILDTNRDILMRLKK